MKTKHTIVLIVALLLSQTIYAAYDLVILKTDGNVVRKAVTDIKEITFTGDVGSKNMVVTAKDESFTTTAIADIREIIFQDPSKEGTVTDIDGNIYKTVKIGTQWWMAENLKTTKYSNGDEISNVTVNADWKNLSTGAYCYYNNDSASYAGTYGALYNWHAVNGDTNGDGTKDKELAPTGWHIPTDAEWTTLTTYLGGESVAGKKLKSASGWNGTDEFGFGALPGGYRQHEGNFSGLAQNAYFWSSSKAASGAYRRLILNSTDAIYRNNDNERYGYSVRCVKDPE